MHVRPTKLSFMGLLDRRETCMVEGQWPAMGWSEIVSERSKASDKKSPLERYVGVLEAMAAAQTPLGLSELAAACNLPVGSAHRLIAGLLSANLLLAEGSTRKTYRIG